MELAIVFGLLVFLTIGMIIYGRERVEKNETELRRREGHKAEPDVDVDDWTLAEETDPAAGGEDEAQTASDQ